MFTKLKTFKTHFKNFLSFINLPCGHVMSHKNLGPIGSAVLTFIGYKQTNEHPNTQTDKPNLYMDVTDFSFGVKLKRKKNLVTIFV